MASIHPEDDEYKQKLRDQWANLSPLEFVRIDEREVGKWAEAKAVVHRENCDSLGLGPDLEPSTKPCNCGARVK